jgi:hypothetical protein
MFIGIAFQVGSLPLFSLLLVPFPLFFLIVVFSASRQHESTSTPGSADLTLSKPGGDLQLGLATGPALHAWEEFPEMGELIAAYREEV